ncbi:MAG: glycosyltransferase family 4 protein [Ferruginibacter sp.]|nr:glycosyltransferase family 4 protein [Ferruginibacter sp.]
MKNLIFLNSHPVQYFAPLYKYLNGNGLPTKAWYCSDESIKGGLDVQFGVEVKWDIPLLEGYESVFLKNYSWKPSHFKGFFGLMNFGVIRQMSKEPKSIIIVHGYHYFTHMMVLLLAKSFGHTLCYRFELPLIHEKSRKTWVVGLRKFFLKHIAFKQVDHFLYIGSGNYKFYKHLDVPDSKLVFCPYSVDNARFQAAKLQLSPQVPQIRSNLGIPADHKVILYSGKYIQKKRPMDVLKAFHQLREKRSWLVMIGDGNLRTEMEQYMAEHDVKQVILTGFINQSKVADYYAMSDLFVMASSVGETWGLSVNEALNFNLPVVVSDYTGSSADLVKNGDNGYTYETGNVDQLAERMQRVLSGELTNETKGQTLAGTYSYDTILKNLKTLSLQ